MIDLKAKYYFDPEDKQGLGNFVSEMLMEGTKKYTSSELADEIEENGMSINVGPGKISMSMLSTDLEKGLELLEEILCNSVFDKKSIEKARERLISEINRFWDTPSELVGQLINEKIYAGHPYSKFVLGTKESIKSITQKDLLDYYKKYISPKGAKLAISGDIGKYDLKKVLEKGLSHWQGLEVEDIEFPELKNVKEELIKYPINRDQTVLCYAGLSIPRTHPDFDKYLLFDQIFGFGALGSMNCKLFQIREKTGLFYTINGTTLARSDEQPGLAVVKAIVSNDRLDEAEKVIKDVINNSPNEITDEEFKDAKSAIVSAQISNFESNAKIAAVFLFLDRFGYPSDYFDNRPARLAKISKEDVSEAVKRVMNTKQMIEFKVGRV